MTEGQPPTPPRRPASARPRQDAATTESTEVAAPTAEELEAIERHRIDWMALLGATVEDREDLGATVVWPSGLGSTPFAARVRWPEAEVVPRLGRTIGVLDERGAWPSIVTASGLTEPADLPERLASFGWLRVGSERILWTRHPTEPPHLEAGIRIEAVTPRTAAECVRLETEIFGLSPAAAEASTRLLADAVGRGEVRAFLVRRIHEAIATARLVPGPLVAGLHAVGVLARHRGRGYGRLVTAVATRAGLATRHRLVWLSVEEGNAVALGLYRSLGYQPSFEWSRWIAQAQPTSGGRG